MKEEKLCVLYASKAHLGLIILEHIRRNTKYEVITFLQDDIKKEINLIKNTTNKYEEIENTKIDNEININTMKLNKMNRNVMIIVEGDDKYIGKCKEQIELMLNENENIEKAQIILCLKYDNKKTINEIATKKYSFITTRCNSN